MAARRLWESYFAAVEGRYFFAFISTLDLCLLFHTFSGNMSNLFFSLGIVFMVDTTDQMRFPEAKEELAKLLSSEELSKVPFLILGNKIDAKNACSEQQLKQMLGAEYTTGTASVFLAKLILC